MALLSSPAAARNREPILAVLRQHLPAGGDVLEVASGSGEHAAWFAEALPQLTWRPTDPSAEALESIAARREAARLPNLLEPLRLDAAAADWPVARADAVVCINMVHISPWEATEGLMAGAARVLTEAGVLVLYGPYREGGRHTAPSNESFDASLKARDPRWGVRDVEAVTAEAERHGLRFRTRVLMPANNMSLVFER